MKGVESGEGQQRCPASATLAEAVDLLAESSDRPRRTIHSLRLPPVAVSPTTMPL